MALTRVTLTAPITASALQFGVSSTAVGFPPVGVISNPQQPVLIDDEFMFLVEVPSSGTVVVRSRGAEGTSAVPHDVLSSVITSATITDFPNPSPGNTVSRPPTTFQDVATYGQDGAITVPTDDITYAILAKASAGAYTLGAPSVALSGMELVLTSTTAAAHVVTATGLYQTGVAGSPFSVATFPAQIGASVRLSAQNGYWNVIAVQGAVVFS